MKKIIACILCATMITGMNATVFATTVEEIETENSLEADNAPEEVIEQVQIVEEDVADNSIDLAESLVFDEDIIEETVQVNMEDSIEEISEETSVLEQIIEEEAIVDSIIEEATGTIVEDDSDLSGFLAEAEEGIVIDDTLEAEEVEAVIEDGATTSGSCGSNATWKISGSSSDGYTLTISGTGLTTDYSYANGKMPPWSKYSKKIKKVVVNKGITGIGDDSFTYYEKNEYGSYSCIGMQKLTSVSLPEGLTYLGRSSLAKSSITSITLPSTFRTIDNMAFFGCSSLTTVKTGKSLYTIGQNAFSGSAIKGITLPEGFQGINCNAFWYCTDLKNVYCPKSMTGIGSGAFSNCPNLVFHCYKDTYAHEYAVSAGLNYKLRSEWIKDSKGWKYFDGSKQKFLKSCWKKIGSYWYHFNSKSYMQTGWIKVDGKWYLLNSNGVMLVGWQKVNDKWYYLNSGGDMATGWKKVSGKWYYLNENGVMQRGWIKLNGKEYYLYYDGHMAANEWIGIYHVNANGVYDKKR